MFKTKNIFKKINIFEVIFLASSFLIFLILIAHPQKLFFDASQYYDLGLGLLKDKYNILSFNFGYRTFVFPLYIASLIEVSRFFNIGTIHLIYISNYLIFLLSTFFIYKSLDKKEKNIGKIFLLLSGLNIVNLSFTNVVLTESLVILFTSILFYLLSKKGEFRKYTLFFIGLIGSLNTLARPSNLFLFICIFIYIIYLIRKKLINVIYFLFPVIIVFGANMINVYNTEGNKFKLFSTLTDGIYDMQVRVGEGSFKYETSIDKKYKNDSVFYSNKLANKKDNGCIKATSCLYYFFKNEPIEYALVLGIHTFNLFDRSYINTYIENIDQVSILLMIYNYFILSSVICYFSFFANFAKLKKYWHIFWPVILISFGTLSIYIPTVIESRFSSSIFPLLVLVASFYLFNLIKVFKTKRFIRICIFQLAIIFIFFIISYLVRQSIVLNIV